MGPPTRPELIFAQRLKSAKRVLVFTGAGISTGSGIPDFRGPNGLWKKWTPVYFDEFVSSHEARVRHWEYKLEGWPGFRAARPNAAHLALVELERLGRLDLLVTQNIDGLHQMAGQSPDRLIELHGTNRQIECIRCRKTFDPDPIFERFAATRQPPCCDCGGFLKPATISFGQAMPAEKLRAAFETAQRVDLAVSVGSTLEVEPAASVPYAALRAGAYYVIVNRGRTAHDSLADLRIEGDATEVLHEVVRLLKEQDASWGERQGDKSDVWD